MIFRLVLITMCFVVRKTTIADGPVLHVGALFEMSDNFYDKYVNFFDDVIEYAFEEIRNRTDILPDYSLKLIIKDTQVIF